MRNGRSHSQITRSIASLLVLGCASGGALPRAESESSAPLSQIVLARSGEGAPVFRIPALAVTNAGTVLAAYDARPSGSDLPSHIAVMLRRSTDGARSFAAPLTVRADTAPFGFGDPSFVVDRRTGRIFLFYAAGVRQGFFGARPGIGATDPEVLQADYSYSDDDGRSWRHRRITAQIKDSAWGGLFASSGEGIQLRRGPHAGRLLQQYAVRFKGANWAATAYSDDHGEHWQMGQLVGPGSDENKVVELADGTLMLNIRAKPARRVAFSNDGGATWTGLRDEPQLVDPGNNGSIIRVAPDAAPSDPRSHWLLFSNTESTSKRVNLTVKLSCDDGRTWPVRRTVEEGASAYSTLTMLRDGRVALLYEGGDYATITLATFAPSWLGAGCR
jgi:sialidase-1